MYRCLELLIPKRWLRNVHEGPGMVSGHLTKRVWIRVATLGRIRVATPGRKKVSEHGTRYGEVVQRLEGLWVHQPRRWFEGCLRPSLGDLGRWVQEPVRGTEGRVQRRPRRQGPRGGKRPRGLELHL